MNTRFTSLVLLWVFLCVGCTQHQDYPEAIRMAAEKVVIKTDVNREDIINIY